jgi:hypothetical protein
LLVCSTCFETPRKEFQGKKKKTGFSHLELFQVLIVEKSGVGLEAGRKLTPYHFCKSDYLAFSISWVSRLSDFQF